MASGVVLGIRLRFHNHAPQKVARGLAFHQQATDEVGGDQLGRATEEGVRERLGERGGLWEWLEKLSPIRSKRRYPLHLKGVKRFKKN